MKCSRGNALFLILIAVALFAALSYAVTQSGRGGRDTTKEADSIAAARVTQYCAGLAIAVQRMILTGTDADDIVFCSTDDPTTLVCAIDSDDACSSGADCVFAAEGGGAQTAPTIDGNALAFAKFIAVDGVGTATNEFLCTQAPLTQSRCEAFNRGLGLSIPPGEDTASNFIYDGEPGEPFACIDYDSTGTTIYQYYHAILER